MRPYVIVSSVTENRTSLPSICRSSIRLEVGMPIWYRTYQLGIVINCEEPDHAKGSTEEDCSVWDTIARALQSPTQRLNRSKLRPYLGYVRHGMQRPRCIIQPIRARRRRREDDEVVDEVWPSAKPVQHRRDDEYAVLPVAKRYDLVVDD